MQSSSFDLAWCTANFCLRANQPFSAEMRASRETGGGDSGWLGFAAELETLKKAYQLSVVHENDDRFAI